jgi:hypothetical protein
MLMVSRSNAIEILPNLLKQVVGGKRVVVTLDGGPVAILRLPRETDESPQVTILPKDLGLRFDDITDAVQAFGNARGVEHRGQMVLIADLTQAEKIEFERARQPVNVKNRL